MEIGKKSTLPKSTPSKANPPKSTPAKSNTKKQPMTPSTPVASTPIKRKQETPSGVNKRFKFELSNLEEENRKLQEDNVPSIVLSMGSGDTGQLGLGEDIFEKKRATEIPNMKDIITIRAGGMHSVCLSKDGKVYTFGCNDEGALGRVIVEDEEATVPGIVELPSDIIVKDITAGDNHSSVLTVDGKVYIWGSFRDNNGLIGLLKPFEKRPTPTLIPMNKKIIKIASGENHFAMLTENGDILTFGCAEQGQLGRISPNNLVRGGRGGLQPLLTPATVRVRNSVKFCDLWAGAFCTVGRSIDGEVYGCGLNNYRQLGLKEELLQLMMTNLEEFNKLGESWKVFTFGQHHTMALTGSKKIFVVGRGEYGSLGQGNNEHCTDVTKVELESDDVLTIAACNRTSYALMNSGEVYSWGMGSSYQLGHGDDEDVNVPTKMVGKQLIDKKVIEISPGFQHVLFRAIPRENQNDQIAAQETQIGNTNTDSRDENQNKKVEETNTDTVMEVIESEQIDHSLHKICTIVEEEKEAVVSDNVDELKDEEKSGDVVTETTDGVNDKEMSTEIKTVDQTEKPIVPVEMTNVIEESVEHVPETGKETQIETGLVPVENTNGNGVNGEEHVETMEVDEIRD